jgi:hypothetical protein
MAGPLIKAGIKVVKRGRKSKRGRPKKKVEVVEKKVVKREDPRKIKKGKGESDAAFKKRKAAINKLIRASNKETARDLTPPKTSAGRRDKLGRLLSKHLPPERKDISKAAFRRLVKSNLIGVTSKGKTKNIGKYAITPEEIMEQWYGRGKKLSKTELDELAAMGMQIKSKGGSLRPKAQIPRSQKPQFKPKYSRSFKLDKRKALVPEEKIKHPKPKKFMKSRKKIDPDKFIKKLKTGGAIGVGVALRGYGKGYK